MVELIHLATLVHDDSVDHSVLRRGMPTINSLFSHQVSVIMGDYLYSRAVIELVRLDDLEPLRVLSRVTNEMTVGEMRQLLAHEPLEFSEAVVRPADPGQDGVAPVRAPARSGALRAPASERAALRRYGEALGMAFQIVDDLLDYVGDPPRHREADRLRSARAQGDAAAHRRAAADGPGGAARRSRR